MWNIKIIASEFCPVFGDWREFGIPNYLVLQNTKPTAFTLSELLRIKPTWGKNSAMFTHTRVKKILKIYS